MRGLALTIEQLDENAVKIALRGELDLEHAYTFDEELKRVEALEPALHLPRPARADLPRLVRARPPGRRPPPRR